MPKPLNPSPARANPGLFGRSKGKTLSPRQQRLMKELLPKLGLPDGSIVPATLWPDADKIYVEIGFGGGEHFIHQAALDPDRYCIGFEPFQNGMAKTLVTLEADPLANVSLEMKDARLVLAGFEKASLDQIFILYPDPWPKHRHWKRRLITPDFVTELARLLRTGGELRFVSDIAHYQQWALFRILQNGQFEWLAENCHNWQNPPTDHCTTKYEQKAFREKRRPAYLQFRKRGV